MSAKTIIKQLNTEGGINLIEYDGDEAIKLAVKDVQVYADVLAQVWVEDEKGNIVWQNTAKQQAVKAEKVAKAKDALLKSIDFLEAQGFGHETFWLLNAIAGAPVLDEKFDNAFVCLGIEIAGDIYRCCSQNMPYEETIDDPHNPENWESYKTYQKLKSNVKVGATYFGVGGTAAICIVSEENGIYKAKVFDELDGKWHDREYNWHGQIINVPRKEFVHPWDLKL